MAQEALENAALHRRGRPRKIPVEPYVKDDYSLEWGIAEALSRYCGIPGCSPRVHMLDATSIVEKLRAKYPQAIKEVL